ncbi:MAG: F0F1 ATP synthase subunit B [Clostridia bacterium]|nr:F0F1 ATP synthase subunit B [Clostridia bacterium]
MTNHLLAILGLDPLDIIAHLVTFVVLIVALGFLVYKPMLKLIHGRQDACRKQIEENAAAKKEAETMKQEYTALLADAEKEVSLKRRVAEEEVAKVKEEELAKAKEEATRLMERAAKEVEAEKRQAVADMKGEIVDVACMIASGILSKEISLEDDMKLVEECLTEWSQTNA